MSDDLPVDIRAAAEPFTPTTAEVREAIAEWAWSRRMFRDELAQSDGGEFDRWQARLTPTREQIADALWNFPINVITLGRLTELADANEGDYAETRDYLYTQADAALALMQELAEGESS